MSNVQQSDGCWEWTGGKWGTYGRFRLNGKNIGAHVASFQHFNGDIPEGLWVLHHCDNRKCVRPDHLFSGTLLDNFDDMRAKQRHSKGKSQPCAKVTDEDVATIRRFRSDGVTATAIAQWYGMSVATICKIIKGQMWAHVPIKADLSIITKAKGSKINTAKLTESDIPVIRRLYLQDGLTQPAIAKLYGVRKLAISMIVRGRRWTHVP